VKFVAVIFSLSAFTSSYGSNSAPSAGLTGGEETLSLENLSGCTSKNIEQDSIAETESIASVANLDCTECLETEAYPPVAKSIVLKLQECGISDTVMRTRCGGGQ